MTIVNFKVNARHISQLGRELVTDFVTALIELVKNSYDADAEGVLMIFDQVTTPSGRIIIVDSGSGMTQDDIITKWTVIGTNNKIRTTHSPGGRKFAGKKGIGRFAVERLAERVNVYSFPIEEQPFKFELNWNLYEEINMEAFRQRLKLLQNNPSDSDSAKFIKRHLDYLLNNKYISIENKKFIKEDLLFNKQLEYITFINNPDLIAKLEEKILPLLKDNQEEEIRIENVQHEILLLSEDEKSNIKYIKNLHQTLNIDKGNPSGLIMVLEGLRDEWSQKDITKLEKELRLLVSPYSNNKNTFKPILQANEFSLQNNVVTNNLIDLFFAKVNAKIIENGMKIVIQYEEKNDKNKITRIFNQEKHLLCGDLDLELLYFIRESQYLSSNELNLRHARDILDEFCGVKIYRDGFHVKPYGDRGNDWLLLDQNKVKDTHSYLIGNNQVIGTINISEDSNPLLTDATNREGIIENESFSDLKIFIHTCIDLITNIRRDEYNKKSEEDRLKKKEEEKRLEEASKRIEEAERERKRKEFTEKNKKELSEILSSVSNSSEADRLKDITFKLHQENESEINFLLDRLEEERKDFDENYQKNKQQFEEKLQGKERELSLYKNLATLGMLTGAFGHETADILNRIAIDIEYTKKWYPETALENKPNISKAYETISEDFERVRGYSNLIVNFVQKTSRDNFEILNFKEVIEKVCKLYGNIIKKQNIGLNLNLDDITSDFKMFKIDLESIVINMLTNSFEALKKTRSKSIFIILKNFEEYYELIFEDNGPGIKDGYADLVFSPFFTTKEEGIGLGLSIVQDIITKYKGIIHVNNSENNGGAQFKIIFPKEGVFLEN